MNTALGTSFMRDMNKAMQLRNEHPRILKRKLRHLQKSFSFGCVHQGFGHQIIEVGENLPLSTRAQTRRQSSRSRPTLPLGHGGPYSSRSSSSVSRPGASPRRSFPFDSRCAHKRRARDPTAFPAIEDPVPDHQKRVRTADPIAARFQEPHTSAPFLAPWPRTSTSMDDAHIFSSR